MIQTSDTSSIEMVLPNHLLHFKIREEEPLEIEGTFQFDPDFIGFQGHFPNRFVLPGVVQLACVRHLIFRAFGRHLRLLMVDRLKYKGMVLPKQTIEIFVQLKPKEMQWLALYSLVCQNKTVMQGQMLLASET